MSYVTEIAELILELNPEQPLLDADQYTTIAEWEKEGIPLEVVKSSIYQALGRPNAASADSVSSAYQAVNANFQNWLRNASI